MARSLKKGPYVDVKLLKRIEDMNFLLIIHLLSFYNLYENIVSLQAFL